ncbi:MAG: carboxypeptidase regulatory-like domain-containing protein [Chloroflexota bacterium]
MKKNYLLFLAFALVVIPSFAQWSTNPAVNNVIADLAGEQVIPKIAVCPNGNIFIAFLSNETGNYDVRLQLLDSQGNELWAHNGLLISNHTTDSWVTDWDMTADVNNHAVLAYNDVRNGNMNVYGYRISPSGAFVWGADGVTLSNNSAFNAAPKVTTTAAGNAIFAWSSDDVIIMQKVNAAGAKQWGNDGITLSATNSLSWPQLLPVGTDDFIMKYFDDAGNPPYPTRHVYAQKYNSSGTAVWASPAVISEAGGISSWTQIFPFINDGSDGFYIAWHDDRDNNQRASIFVQHISSSGQVLFGANGVEASTASGFNHYYANLALPAGSSEIYVFWNEMDADQNYNGIFGQKLSASGSRMWGSSGMTFIPLTLGTITPEDAQSSATDMVVLYSQGSLNSQLKAMRIGTDGSFVWPSQFITVSSVSSSKGHVVMSKFASDQWVAVWEDNRNGASDIYAQNFSIEGTLGPYQLSYGSIQGHVTLTGGNGNVTQALVTTGVSSTYPDPTGDYFLQTQTGTYDVIASLSGYYPDTVFNVTVLEDQSTLGVDFNLVAVPTTGYIEGTVTLANGNGDVTQTVISVGQTTTNPDASGHYSMEVGVGTWDVGATLDGYTPQMQANISVQPGLTTQNVNFNLSLLPTTGFLYGTVTIEGNMADVTLAAVTAGNATTHPDANGDYLIELPVGTIQVTASHPYTQPATESVEIVPGGSTGQDFQLLMLRRDLICKVYSMGSYDPLFGAVVHITGPEGAYDGVMETDSIIFPQVPYGNYEGTATYMNAYVGESDTLIDQNNNFLPIWVLIESAKQDQFKPLAISPNPVTANGTVTFSTDIKTEGWLTVSDLSGRKISQIYLNTTNQTVFPVSLLFNKQTVKQGQYFLNFVSQKGTFNGKLLVR